MPKYLFEARYSSAGANGIAREGGVGRRAAARKHLEELGGKLESMYFAFGEVDCFLIADLPANASAAAFSLLDRRSRRVRPAAKVAQLTASGISVPTWVCLPA